MSLSTFEPTTDQDDFRQGDVIRFLPEAKRADNAVLAIVVTADCDIVQQKFQGSLSIVPGYDISEFLHTYRFSTLARKPAADLAERIIEELSMPRPVDMSPEALVDWIQKAPPIAVASRIAETVGEETLGQPEGWLAIALNQVRALLVPERTDLPGYCEVLANARRFSKSAEAPITLTDKMFAKASIEICKALDPREQLPSDYFAALNPGPELPGLYYANLRRIEAISPLRVSVGYQDEEAKSPLGERVARLIPVVRYALTQKMAYLFSRIGIPGEIENAISDHIGSLMEKRP